MNKADFDTWLSKKVEFQRKIVTGAVAAMVTIGLVLLLLEGGLLYLIMEIAYGSAVGIIAVLGAFGGMTFYIYTTAPKKHRDNRHKVLIDDEKVSVRVAPTTAATWHYAFGNIDSSQSIIEHIFGVITMVPRMFWSARYLYRRIADITEIDIDQCGRIIRMLLKKSERVDIAEIAAKYPKMEISQTIRQMSLIDGIVFLTKKPMGLSLAKRFTDDLETGMAELNGGQPEDTD